MDLGTYDSFVSHNQPERDAVIGLTTSGSIEADYVRPLITLGDQVEASRSPSPAKPMERYMLTSRFRCGLKDTAGSESVDAPRRRSDLGHPRQAFLKEATFELKFEVGFTLAWKIVTSSDPTAYYDALIPPGLLREDRWLFADEGKQGTRKRQSSGLLERVLTVRALGTEGKGGGKAG